jgi:hypothetical protein
LPAKISATIQRLQTLEFSNSEFFGQKSIQLISPIQTGSKLNIECSIENQKTMFVFRNISDKEILFLFNRRIVTIACHELIINV